MASFDWPLDAIEAQLRPLLPDLLVECVSSCPSTNSALIDRARGGETTPCLLVAEEQTAGRGRQGRRWHSAPGASLTFSLSLPFAPRDWQGLSLAVGLALADALDGDGQAIGVKWPNDLWLRERDGSGRKLAGVLIETVAAGSARVAVIGIGINIETPQGLDTTPAPAGLRELDRDARAPAVLLRIARPLVQALGRFESSGFAPQVDAFATRDLLRGQAVVTTQPGATAGVAEGVDDQGALHVRTEAGLVQRITSGEVSVRPRPGEAARR